MVLSDFRVREPMKKGFVFMFVIWRFLSEKYNFFRFRVSARHKMILRCSFHSFHFVSCLAWASEKLYLFINIMKNYEEKEKREKTKLHHNMTMTKLTSIYHHLTKHVQNNGYTVL